MVIYCVFVRYRTRRYMLGRKSVILYDISIYWREIIYCGLFMRMKNGYMIHRGQYIYDEYVRYIASLFKAGIL